MYMLHRPIGSMSWYILPTFTYIYQQKSHIYVARYTSPMDPMGMSSDSFPKRIVRRIYLMTLTSSIHLLAKNLVRHQ